MRKLAFPWLIFLLTVGFAVLLSGCGGGQPTTVSHEITATDGGTISLDGAITVRIPPGALSTDATVKITRASGDAPSSLESALPVGEAFNVDLGGATLTRPVTIEIAYDPDLLPKETPREVAFLAFYDEALEEWQPVYGTVDLDKHVIVIETDHLSRWQPWTWDISAVADAIMDRLNSLFELGGLPSAEIPDCGRAPRDMTLDFSATLLPCLEADGSEGEALLKVANNRAYAVLLDLSRSEPRHRVEDRGVTRGSFYDAAWDAIVDKLAEDLVYVPPAAEAQVAMQFADEGEIRILSAPSDLTLGIEVLLAMLGALAADPQTVADGVECLYEVISAGGEEPLTLGDLVDIAKDCASAVLDGTLGIVWNVVRNFVTLGAASGELLVDRTLGDGTGQVVVSYKPETEPPAVDAPQQTATPIPSPSRYGATGYRDGYCHAVLWHVQAGDIWEDDIALKAAEYLITQGVGKRGITPEELAGQFRSGWNLLPPVGASPKVDLPCSASAYYCGDPPRFEFLLVPEPWYHALEGGYIGVFLPCLAQFLIE